MGSQQTRLERDVHMRDVLAVASCDPIDSVCSFLIVVPMTAGEESSTNNDDAIEIAPSLLFTD